MLEASTVVVFPIIRYDEEQEGLSISLGGMPHDKT